MPDRTNVVITRQRDFRAEGCVVAGSLEEAIERFPKTEEVFIIGGAQVYAQALPLADRLYITEVEADYQGDTRFPAWDRGEWIETFRQRHERGEAFDHPFSFVDYRRR